MWINFISFSLLGFICLIPAAGIKWNNFDSIFWFYCAAAGIISALGNGFLVKALEKGDLSILGPINSYKSVVSMMVGIFLLGEIPQLWAVIGIALIIFGSYFVLDTLPERFSWTLFKRSEIQYRIWAMVLTAIEAIFIKKIILLSNVTVSFIVWCVFGAFFSFWLLLFLKVDMRKQWCRQSSSVWRFFLFLTLTIGLTQLTTNYVFDRMNVSYALALFQLSSIVAVFLGYKIFRETNIRKKLLGSAIMIIGAALIILIK